MNERKYIAEIEGLMVEITYEYKEGCKGDRDTPPTEDRVYIKYWELVKGEEEQKEIDQLSDHAWDSWMFDIEEYVYNHAQYDIIEFEHDLEY